MPEENIKTEFQVNWCVSIIVAIGVFSVIDAVIRSGYIEWIWLIILILIPISFGLLKVSSDKTFKYEYGTKRISKKYQYTDEKCEKEIGEEWEATKDGNGCKKKNKMDDSEE